MQRAKAFFFVCLGILALAVAYHFGATTATAQAPGNACVAMTNYNLSSTIGYEISVLTENGDVYGWDRSTWTHISNVFTNSPPVTVQRESWGSVKQRYLSPDAARSGQASRPRR